MLTTSDVPSVLDVRALSTCGGPGKEVSLTPRSSIPGLVDATLPRWRGTDRPTCILQGQPTGPHELLTTALVLVKPRVGTDTSGVENSTRKQKCMYEHFGPEHDPKLGLPACSANPGNSFSVGCRVLSSDGYYCPRARPRQCLATCQGLPFVVPFISSRGGGPLKNQIKSNLADRFCFFRARRNGLA